MAIQIYDRTEFNDNATESAYELLLSIKHQLKEQTKGILEMDIEAVDSFLNIEPYKPVLLYIVYVKAPALANYRKKVISVIERKDVGRFPVQVYSHLDNYNEEDVMQENFLKKISEFMNRPAIDRSIVTLYRQANQADKEAKLRAAS